MSMPTIFDHQSYLNLETFRKDGSGVKTPVWFIQDGDTLFVRTIDNSGKVKRVHQNGSVNIAPARSMAFYSGRGLRPPPEKSKTRPSTGKWTACSARSMA